VSTAPPSSRPASATEGRDAPGAPFGRLLLVWATLAVALALVVAVFGSLNNRDWATEALFFWRQDLPVQIACLGFTAALALAPPAWLARAGAIGRPAARVWVGLLAAVCLVAGWIGWWLVFGGYSFSLDEFLANFDAKIFASGRLMAPVPPAWQGYVPALQPMYMLPLPNSVWASSYLPVNAGLRALGRLAYAEPLVNPLLSAISIVALWGVGRQLWPERPSLALIAAALMGTSPQLIVMSMTAYAMPAHLAFNLVWLWLFLRGGRLGHAGAIATGFLATGIHQLIFHPIFVAPFVLQLWVRRRWGLAALYTLAYAAICLFWVEYWPLASSLSGVQPGDSDSTGGDYMMDRISDVLDNLYWRDPGVIAENLVRFVSWQNLLVAPLALAGAISTVRTRGYLRPLVMGVFLTLAAVFIATPTQTHGWGYRYLHGLLGSIALVAAWGWARLTDSLAAERKAAAAGGFAVASVLSLLVLTPARAWQAWSYVRPFAAANAVVQNAPADVVIIDHNSSVLFDMGTLTRNDPFLERRPKVMALIALTGPGVRRLCATQRVLVFNGQSARAWGLDTVPWRGSPYAAQLRALMKELGCYRVITR
jgi:hypothetical protein